MLKGTNGINVIPDRIWGKVQAESAIFGFSLYVVENSHSIEFLTWTPIHPWGGEGGTNIKLPTEFVINENKISDNFKFKKYQLGIGACYTLKGRRIRKTLSYDTFPKFPFKTMNFVLLFNLSFFKKKVLLFLFN